MIEQDQSAFTPILTRVINDLTMPMSWLEGSVVGPLIVDRQMMTYLMQRIEGDSSTPLAYAQPVSNEESMPVRNLEGIAGDQSMPVPIIGVAKINQSMRVDILKNVMKDESANIQDRWIDLLQRDSPPP